MIGNTEGKKKFLEFDEASGYMMGLHLASPTAWNFTILVDLIYGFHATFLLGKRILEKERFDPLCVRLPCWDVGSAYDTAIEAFGLFSGSP